MQMIFKILYTITATVLYAVVMYCIWSYHIGIPKWIKSFLSISESSELDNQGKNVSNAINQNSTGNNSPNINAINSSINFNNYGMSQAAIEELIQKTGKVDALEDILKDWKEKSVPASNQEEMLKTIMAMITSLEKQLNEKSFQNTDEDKPLEKFNHQEFIDNFVAFKAYYHYRKTLKLLNPQKLIEFLNIYLRSILLYPSPENKPYNVTNKEGSLLRLAIEGRNQSGEKVLISLPELSGTIFHDVCNDFVKSADAKDYDMLIKLFNRALATNELDKVHKLYITDAEAFIKKNKVVQNF